MSAPGPFQDLNIYTEPNIECACQRLGHKDQGTEGELGKCELCFAAEEVVNNRLHLRIPNMKCRNDSNVCVFESTIALGSCDKQIQT